MNSVKRILFLMKYKDKFGVKYTLEDGIIKVGDTILNDHNEVCKVKGFFDYGTIITDREDIDPNGKTYYTSEPYKTIRVKQLKR